MSTRNMFNKVAKQRLPLAFLLLLALSFFNFVPVGAETQMPADYHKEEVIYARLDAQGAPQQVIAMNQLRNQRPLQLKEQGEYEDFQVLSSEAVLQYADGIVSGNLASGTWSYRGDLKKRALPWQFALRYSLDGQSLPPSDLAGATGLFHFELETRANPQVDESYREAYFLLLSFQLDQGVFQDLEPGKGFTLRLGKNYLLNYLIILPESGSQKLSFSCQVKDFQLASPTLMALPLKADWAEILGDLPQEKLFELFMPRYAGANLANPEDSGLNQLGEAGSQLDTAAQDIGSALEQLAVAAKELSSSENLDAMRKGEKALAQGLNDYQSGIKQYLTGLAASSEGAQQLAQAAASYGEALNQLKEQGPQLQANFNLLQENFAALSQMTASSEMSELPALAGLLKALAELNTGLEAFQQGLSQYTEAVTAVADNYPQVEGGISELSAALSHLVKGNSRLEQGLSKLIQGQKVYAEGLEKYFVAVGQVSSGLAELHKQYPDFAQGVHSFNQAINELLAQYMPPEGKAENWPQKLAEKLPVYQAKSFVDPANPVDYVQYLIFLPAISQ